MENTINKLELNTGNKAGLLKYLTNLQNSSLFDFDINETEVKNTYKEMDEAKYIATYKTDLLCDEYVITNNDNKVLYIWH